MASRSDKPDKSARAAAEVLARGPGRSAWVRAVACQGEIPEEELEAWVAEGTVPEADPDAALQV